MAIDIVDINEDGLLDILCTSPYENSIYWLEQNYFGDYTQHLIDSSFYAAKGVQAKDMNKDGKLDIIVSGSGLKLYLQEDNYTFSTRILDSLGDDRKFQAWKLEAIDLDNDQDEDILLSSRQDGFVFFYENDNLSFTRHTLIEELPITYCLSINDLINDGKLDVLSSSQKAARPKLLIQQDSLQFSNYNLCDSAFAVQTVFANLNHDYLTDIVCFSHTKDEIHLHYQKDSMVFETDTLNHHFAPGILEVLCKDFDQNGFNDILYTNYFGSIDILYQNKLGEFQLDTLYKSMNPTAVEYIDYDKDGDNDIIVCSSGTGQIVLLDNL